jgi:tetratricopeptide (TPR) repeat protein
VPGNRYRGREDSAVHYFERAIKLDPELPLPYIGLADIYHSRFFNIDASPQWEQLATINVDRALRIDPDLAEGYQMKGAIIWTLSNGFPHEAASRLHHEALRKRPSYADPHFALGALYMHTGLLDRALAQFDTAQSLDPENGFARPRIARTHYMQGKLDQAAREFAPFPQWAGERAIALALLGRRDEAMKALSAPLIDTTHGARADHAAATGVVLVTLGRRDEALARLAEAESLGSGVSHFHHAAYMIAQAYALMGDADHALTWLDRVATEGMPCYPLFRDDVALARVRSDPRFARWLDGQRKQWEEFQRTL